MFDLIAQTAHAARLLWLPESAAAVLVAGAVLADHLASREVSR